MRSNMEENTLPSYEYVAQTLVLLDLQLNSEQRTAVIENFVKIQAIAQLVNDFPLPSEIEVAPVFEP